MSDFTVIDIETTGNLPWEHQLVSVGIGRNVWPGPGHLARGSEKGRTFARMTLARPGIVVAHTNYDLRWLMLDGAQLAEGVKYHDTKVMAWMLDATQELALDGLAARYLGYTPPKVLRKVKGRIMFTLSSGEMVPIEEAPWDELEAYNYSDIKTEGELYECLRELLQREGLWDQFLTEEVPFSRLLVEMEATGLPFDKERAIEMLAKTELEHARLREMIVGRTGAIDFNPGSGDQVAKYLYEELWTNEVKFPIPRLNGMSKEDKLAAVQEIAPAGVRVEQVGRDYAYGTQHLEGRALKLPRVPKWKAEQNPDARPSVSAKVLTILHGSDPWVSKYLEWKKLDTLAGYLRSWIEKEHNGRLHGRFDQSGTITGRLAGKEPNLQQVASTNGVRDLFRGDLVVGDFGGLEARLAAHFSGDETMLDIFRSGKDLYGTLAAKAWGGEASKENPGRGLFKVVWLASQYGAQGQTLADTMAIAGMRGYTARKADALLRDLEETCPRLFEWRNEVIEEARHAGYVTTLGGRKRRLPDIDSAEWKQMAKSERQAVNSTVQGSAADVVRRVMLAARKAVPPNVARICLQVHDEILWERGPDWDPEIFPRLVEICEHHHGFDLDVPLAFEAKIADSWAAKGGSAGQAAAGAYAHLNDALEAAAA